MAAERFLPTLNGHPGKFGRYPLSRDPWAAKPLVAPSARLQLRPPQIVNDVYHTFDIVTDIPIPRHHDETNQEYVFRCHEPDRESTVLILDCRGWCHGQIRHKVRQLSLWNGRPHTRNGRLRTRSSKLNLPDSVTTDTVPRFESKSRRWRSHSTPDTYAHSAGRTQSSDTQWEYGSAEGARRRLLVVLGLFRKS